MFKSENLRCFFAAFALWIHDSREPIKAAAQIAFFTALAFGACWLYCALGFVFDGAR